MTDNHPITPPPQLVEQWSWWSSARGPFAVYLATQAARWGADQELEACCEYMQHEDFHGFATELRTARRPKPPSLKEQALETLKYPKDFWSEAEVDTIRRALEALDD